MRPADVKIAEGGRVTLKLDRLGVLDFPNIESALHAVGAWQGLLLQARDEHQKDEAWHAAHGRKDLTRSTINQEGQKPSCG